MYGARYILILVALWKKNSLNQRDFFKLEEKSGQDKIHFHFVYFVSEEAHAPCSWTHCKFIDLAHQVRPSSSHRHFHFLLNVLGNSAVMESTSDPFPQNEEQDRTTLARSPEVSVKKRMSKHVIAPIDPRRYTLFSLINKSSVSSNWTHILFELIIKIFITKLFFHIICTKTPIFELLQNCISVNYI